MLDRIKAELACYEGTWILPDDLDALMEIIAGVVPGEEWIRIRPALEYNPDGVWKEGEGGDDISGM